MNDSGVFKCWLSICKRWNEALEKATMSLFPAVCLHFVLLCPHKVHCHCFPEMVIRIKFLMLNMKTWRKKCIHTYSIILLCSGFFLLESLINHCHLSLSSISIHLKGQCLVHPSLTNQQIHSNLQLPFLLVLLIILSKSHMKTCQCAQWPPVWCGDGDHETRNYSNEDFSGLQLRHHPSLHFIFFWKVLQLVACWISNIRVTWNIKKDRDMYCSLSEEIWKIKEGENQGEGRGGPWE